MSETTMPPSASTTTTRLGRGGAALNDDIRGSSQRCVR
jgi:hypothetical protein